MLKIPFSLISFLFRMRRIIFSILVALSIFTPVLAFSPGHAEVLQNLNIHSSEHFVGNLIDYFQKGTVVNVVAVDHDWCKVEHYKFANAYVRCDYLQPTDKNYVRPFQTTPTQLTKTFNQVFSPSENASFDAKKVVGYVFSGTRTTVVNANVRSTPRIGNNRIGYIKKGTDVEITAIQGNWCQVNYKNFKKAYVYCSLFGIANEKAFTDSLHSQLENGPVKPEPAQAATTETALSPGQKSLDDLYHWLMDNNESGRFYINNSGEIGLKKAEAWQADATIAAIRFDFPKELEGYCVYNYVSDSDPDHVFQYNCAEPGSEGSTKIVPKSQVSYVGLRISHDFQVPMAAVVARMIDAQGRVWPTLKSFFADSKKIQMEFTLSADAQGTFWTGKVSDENGALVKVRVDGTDSSAELMLFTN